MLNNSHTKRKSKAVKARSDNNGPDEKKTRLENVDKIALSFLETCKSFVRLNVNPLKNVDKTALVYVNGLNKPGNIYFIILHSKRKTTKGIYSQRKILHSIIFVRLYPITFLSCITTLHVNKAGKTKKNKK